MSLILNFNYLCKHFVDDKQVSRKQNNLSQTKYLYSNNRKLEKLVVILIGKIFFLKIDRAINND